jgi:hypothetical protein
LVFQEPTATLLIIVDVWSIISLIEILENRREYFRRFVGKFDTLAGRFEELRPNDVGEVGRLVQDAFVSGE